MKDQTSGKLVRYYYVTVMLDLDGTLFVIAKNDKEAEFLKTHSHIALASDELYNEPCYLIYPQQTRNLLLFLLRMPGVRVGINTAAQYSPEHILPFLERVYKLPPGCLRNCMFVNAYNLGDAHTGKGYKLASMRNRGVFRHTERVIALDDSVFQIQDTLDNGFDGVHATGYCLSYDPATDEYYFSKPPSDTYFKELQEKVNAHLDFVEEGSIRAKSPFLTLTP